MAPGVSAPVRRDVRFCTFVEDADVCSDGQDAPPGGAWCGRGPIEAPLGAAPPGTPPGAGAPAPPERRGTLLQVKNTFICVEEESPTEHRSQRQRASTLPASMWELLPASDDHEGSDAFDSGEYCGSDRSSASCRTQQEGAVDNHRSLAESTPTPWPEDEERKLRFWTPLQAAPVAAPAPALSPSAASGAHRAARAPRRAVLAGGPRAPLLGHGEAPGGASVSARDRSLVVTLVGSAYRVRWTVESKKLRGSDKQAVSPPLEVPMQQGSAAATFKLMLCPRGGDSFKKADGVGQVQLKCCSDLPEGSLPLTAISIAVGAEAPRGPFAHRFGSSSVFSVPREQSDWNFGAAVEAPAAAFTVTVEIAPLV